MAPDSSIRRMAKRAALALTCALALGLVASGTIPLGGVEGLRAGNPGPIVDLPDGRGEAELFSFDSNLVPVLLSTAPESEVEVADWPASPGVRHSVRLARHEIYALSLIHI